MTKDQLSNWIQLAESRDWANRKIAFESSIVSDDIKRQYYVPTLIESINNGCAFIRKTLQNKSIHIPISHPFEVRHNTGCQDLINMIMRVPCNGGPVDTYIVPNILFWNHWKLPDNKITVSTKIEINGCSNPAEYLSIETSFPLPKFAR